MPQDPHAPLAEASAWVRRFAPMVPAGKVLDLACGSGRHSRLFLDAGMQVTAVDRDLLQLGSLATTPGLTPVQADLEDGSPWPLGGQSFQAVVVTNYLWRPLLPQILRAVAAGGLLLYETFAKGNEQLGKPRNPDFLLDPGELLDLVRGEMQVVAFEQVRVEIPKPAVVQRLCATRDWCWPAEGPNIQA